MSDEGIFVIVGSLLRKANLDILDTHKILIALVLGGRSG